MKILGKIDLRTILYFGVSEILITIILCYVLAVTLQHQPVWLPTISECGELSPEKYFFRWGILVGGLLLVIESTVLRAADRISTITFYAGVLAGLCLTGVAVVASNENLPVHLVFALSFFGLENVTILLMLFDNYQSTNHKSLAIRASSVAIASIATTIRFLLVFDFVGVHNDIPIVAIIEWIDTFAIIIYHMTLSDELDVFYLAVLSEYDKSQNVKSSLTPSLPVKTPL